MTGDPDRTFYDAWRTLLGGEFLASDELGVDVTDELRTLLLFCAGAATALEMFGGPDGRSAGEKLTAGALLQYEVEKALRERGEEQDRGPGGDESPGPEGR